MNERKSWNRTAAAPGRDRVLQILAETLCMRDPDSGLVMVDALFPSHAPFKALWITRAAGSKSPYALCSLVLIIK